MTISAENFYQSISKQNESVETLQVNLQQLSIKLESFVKNIAQSEKPITEGTILLHQVQQTTIALESHLHSILSEIENLSPQSIKMLTTSYMEQIQALQVQLSNIDISSIKTVTTSIDSFSTSIQALQKHINSQVQSLKIDQKSLQNSIQAQVQQALANQSEQIENSIQTLLKEKLSTQRATHTLWAMMAFGVLILLMNFLLSYQASSNLKTITAQREVIQQNSQIISNQNSNMY